MAPLQICGKRISKAFKIHKASVVAVSPRSIYDVIIVCQPYDTMDSLQKPQVTVLETCRVSPPPCSVASSLLPLTYFDVICARIPPVKRLFLYTFPCSTSDFLNLHVPNLKRSLPLTLQRFFPLAGSLVAGDVVQNISYAEGDSVVFTVAESRDSLPDLVGNHPRDILRFRCLVSDLPTCDAKQPVLALQATVFPDHGIGIGLTTHHAALDGSTAMHFVNTWASINRTLGDSSLDMGEVPLHLPLIDRSVVPDKERLLNKLLETSRGLNNSGQSFRRVQRDTTACIDVVRATFVLTRANLDSIRQWTLKMASITCSDFVLVLAVLWVCIAGASGWTGTHDDAIDGLAFFADCRGRPGRSIPANYFGNCLTPCVAEARRSDLFGHDGMARAAKAIWRKIQELKGESEPIGKDMIPIVKRIKTMQTVAGSPRLGVYKVDFGWGKPRKVEVVSIDTNGAVSLAENEGAGGGIEMGMALPMEEMDKFSALFYDLVQKH